VSDKHIYQTPCPALNIEFVVILTFQQTLHFSTIVVAVYDISLIFYQSAV